MDSKEVEVYLEAWKNALSANMNLPKSDRYRKANGAARMAAPNVAAALSGYTNLFTPNPDGTKTVDPEVLKVALMKRRITKQIIREWRANGYPDKVTIDSSTPECSDDDFESKSLLQLYREYADEFDAMPADEAVVHFTGCSKRYPEQMRRLLKGEGYEFDGLIVKVKPVKIDQVKMQLVSELEQKLQALTAELNALKTL